jgi:superfamily II DNA/RNA helicase
MQQAARERALDAFALGFAPVLIATDVAGRGLDVSGIDLVIQYELPRAIEEVTHRVGRTGRAGAPGTAVSFCFEDDGPVLYYLREMVTAVTRAQRAEAERTHLLGGTLRSSAEDLVSTRWSRGGDSEFDGVPDGAGVIPDEMLRCPAAVNKPAVAPKARS